MPRPPREPQNSASEKKEFYSTLEAADLLGVSFQTVARWMDRGYLQGWRTPGGHRFINASSLEEMLRKGQTSTTREAPAASAGLRILAVDDSADDLLLLRATLLSVFPNASISTADNAFAALISIGMASPDVLITDIMMPDVDGVEMIRNLRENPQTSSIMVIVVSSYREKALAQKFGPLPEGVPFLSKPVQAEALQALIPDAEARDRQLRAAEGKLRAAEGR